MSGGFGHRRVRCARSRVPVRVRAAQGNFGAEWLDWTFGTMDSYVQIGFADGYIKHCKRIGEAAAGADSNKSK